MEKRPTKETYNRDLNMPCLLIAHTVQQYEKETYKRAL